jgi:hypoxanthine phosphoribosyltransferase
MLHDVERKLFDEATILRRLDFMAHEITQRYRGLELTVVVVLNGSLIFAADLLRRIELPLKLECIRATSYYGGTESSGVVDFPAGALPDIAGRHVLIVDDILDTGRTLHALCQWLRASGGPLSVEICVLLAKAKARAEEVSAAYVGFEVGDEFVVGYGLDFRAHYRNLPFIGTLRREVIAACE